MAMYHPTRAVRAIRVLRCRTSHHLRCLAAAGLLNSRREGKYIFYALDPMIHRKRLGKNSRPVLDFGCCRIELKR
ncbi:hypothetical protein BH18VER1_BH18VER1_20680 [soil metagenome]